MALAIIDISDTGIQLAIGDEVVNTSPGIAVLDGDRLLLGQEALNNARLLPRWTNNRFWNQLSTDPIANRTANIRHHADLAFAHLESIWTPVSADVDAVILLVPCYYDHQQLGLLLGIANECGMPVAGVADSSLLAVSGTALTPLSLHLDIHLHRITLAKIHSGAVLSRREVTTVAELGLFTLWERWGDIIANQFIQTSRFDPMHQASSEQALFNALPGWIAERGMDRSHAFELELGDVHHRVIVTSDQLVTACTQIFPQIVQSIRAQIPTGTTATLIVSPRFAGIPGLRDSLDLITNLATVQLEPDEVIRNAFVHADKITSDEVISHVVSLPIAAMGLSPNRQDSERATHLLKRNSAVPVGSAFKLSEESIVNLTMAESDPACTIYPHGNALYIDVHTTGIVQLNGQPVSDQTTIAPGDVLSIGGEELTFISVAGHGN